MHAGMVAERLDVHRPPITPSTRTLRGVLAELEAAQRFITSVGLIAHTRLTADDRYELTAAEGLIAGAIKKIEAATR